MRLTVPNAHKLFGKKPNPYKSFKESTEWLNFIIYRILTHFQTDESIKKINKIVNSSVAPHHFNLLSLGNAPIVKHVLTLEMKDPDDIKILIPLEWKKGPSLDFILNKNLLRVEFDLKYFCGKMLVSWPGSNPTQLEFRLIDEFIIDFDLAIQYKNKVRFSFMKIPLIGQIVKGIIELIVTRQVFELTLPNPIFGPNSPRK